VLTLWQTWEKCGNKATGNKKEAEEEGEKGGEEGRHRKGGDLHTHKSFQTSTPYMILFYIDKHR